jgi:hypothetical protein
MAVSSIFDAQDRDRVLQQFEFLVPRLARPSRRRAIMRDLPMELKSDQKPACRSLPNISLDAVFVAVTIGEAVRESWGLRLM